MTPQRIRLAALGFGLLVLTAGFLAWNRTVTILADGQAIEVTARAATVSGALRAAGIELGPQDEAEPAPYAPLFPDMVIAVHRAARIQLYVDGVAFETVSTEPNPQALLDQFGVELGENDRLLLAGESISLDEDLPASGLLSLEIRRAVEVTLSDKGSSRTFLSSAPTLGEALAEQGIRLYAADRLVPAANTALDAPLSVQLIRSQPAEIIVGDERFEIRTAAETVGEALAEAGVALQDLDRSEPAENAPVPEDGEIRVVRVQEQVEIQSELIPFTVEWQPDPETEIDGRSVIQLGQNGLRASSVRVRLEDGEEVSRLEESEWVLAEPVTQISGYGTNIVVRTAVVDGVEIDYWRAVDLFATSYSPCRSGTESCYYYTSLGDEVKQGIAGVYLSWWYAMGNHTVYVPGYGPAKISDVGAYPDGRPWIDLAYSDEDWVPWAQWVTVYFTTPIPPESEILYILP